MNVKYADRTRECSLERHPESGTVDLRTDIGIEFVVILRNWTVRMRNNIEPGVCGSKPTRHETDPLGSMRVATFEVGPDLVEKTSCAFEMNSH